MVSMSTRHDMHAVNKNACSRKKKNLTHTINVNKPLKKTKGVRFEEKQP